ncbi:MAG: hypothetical protein GY857_14450 [Desulfobacula sp.]|nr:hypothetical protein [Desulfobacula sp.]
MLRYPILIIGFSAICILLCLYFLLPQIYKKKKEKGTRGWSKI